MHSALRERALALPVRDTARGVSGPATRRTIRQSTPDSVLLAVKSYSGLSFQVEALKTVQIIPSSLGSGPHHTPRPVRTSTSPARAARCESGCVLSNFVISHISWYLMTGVIRRDAPCLQPADMAHVRYSLPYSGLDSPINRLSCPFFS